MSALIDGLGSSIRADCNHTQGGAMLRDLFQISRVRVKDAQRIYPHGLDWTLRPGVNVIAGGTGLGKTTFIHATLFALFGTLGKSSKRDVEKVDSAYFAGRMVRTTDFDPLRPPTATVEATFGNLKAEVSRNLSNGKLITAMINGVEVDQSEYETTVAKALGLEDYEGELLRLVDHLVYLSETPHAIAWDSMVQNEVMTILFGQPKEFVELSGLWEKVAAADSEFRNIRHQATRVQRQIEALQPETSSGADANSPEAVATRRIENEFARVRAEEARAEAAARWNESNDRTQDLERRVAELQGKYRQLSQVLSEVEVGADEVLFEWSPDSPRSASIFAAIAALTESPQETRCLCCSRIPGRTTRALAATRQALQSAECPVCGTELAGRTEEEGVAEQPSPEVVADAEARIAPLAETLRANLSALEQTRSRLAVHMEELRRAEAAVQAAREAEWTFNLKHPISAGSLADQQHIMLDGLRKEQRRSEDALNRHIVSFKTARDQLNRTLRKLRNDIATSFQKYCRMFLDEPVEIEFDESGERAERRGPQTDPLHSAFYPVVDGEPRYRADTLSEAQRTFVDLAFRMALLDVWSVRSKRPAMLVVETPEGSVDAAYMARVAELLRKFAQQHQVLVTTNINNDIFLPQLFVGTPKRERPARLLNLLELGVPRKVQQQHSAQFARIIRAAVG